MVMCGGGDGGVCECVVGVVCVFWGRLCDVVQRGTYVYSLQYHTCIYLIIARGLCNIELTVTTMYTFVGSCISHSSLSIHFSSSSSFNTTMLLFVS